MEENVFPREAIGRPQHSHIALKDTRPTGIGAEDTALIFPLHHTWSLPLLTSSTFLGMLELDEIIAHNHVLIHHLFCHQKIRSRSASEMDDAAKDKAEETEKKLDRRNAVGSRQIREMQRQQSEGGGKSKD